MNSRLKKFGYTAAVGAGLFAGAAGIASAATGNGSSNPATSTAASASTNTADQPDGNDDKADITSSITVPDSEGASEADEQTQLAALATVTADQASAAATKAVPGTVDKVELENEDGSVVYKVDVTTSNGAVEVIVDAGNAAILSQEADDAGHGDHGDGDGDGGHDGHSNTDSAHEAAESPEHAAAEAADDASMTTTP